MSVTMENDKATKFSRLPTNVVPSYYKLIIRSEISDCTFSGIETIDVQFRERTKTIVLNSLDISIQSASFVSNDKGKLKKFFQLITSKFQSKRIRFKKLFISSKLEFLII